MQKERIRIGVVFGGRSSEHEVSLVSAHAVLEALSPDKYQIIPIGITHNGIWLTGPNTLKAMESGDTSPLQRIILLPGPQGVLLYSIDELETSPTMTPLCSLDVIFPVLHGSYGEDGTIQGYFEMLDMPYVGAGVLSSSVCMDKGLFKDVMRSHNLPVLPSLTFTSLQVHTSMDRVLDQAEAISPYPLFVKPSNGGSSVGISKCHNRSDLMEGIIQANQFDRRVMIEKGLTAREIEVSVLGNQEPQASIPGEIIPADEFYTYDAKYHSDLTQLIIPANLEQNTVGKIQELAKKAFKAIDCSGMARVDFLMDKNSGDLYLSEINTIPGFTPISMYPKLWAASGLSYPTLVDRLVELALERKAENDILQRVYRRAG